MKPILIIATAFSLVFCSFTYGQSWQNITQRKGGYATSDLKQDSKGNLYVITPAGVYSSSNNGSNWAKLGKGFYSALKLNPSQVDPLTIGSFLEVVKDTVHVFFSTGSGFTSVYYEKGSNSWKNSSLSLPSKNSNLYLYQTSSLVAYLSGNNVLSYSSDGMKTWKSSVLGGANTYLSPSYAVVLDNKLFFFTSSDTVFITNNGASSRKKYIPNKNPSTFYNGGIVNSNNTIVSFGVKGTYNGTTYVYDTIVGLRLDTLSFTWSLLGKSKYTGASTMGMKLTTSGYLYISINTAQTCFLGIQRTVDWGKTWETMAFQENSASQFVPYAVPITEIGGKVYLTYATWIMQNTTSLSSTNFQYTAADNFGFQMDRDNYFYDFAVTKNYVGNPFVLSFCSDNGLNTRARWDGTWNKLQNSFATTTPPYTYYPRNTQNYFLMPYQLITGEFPSRYKFFISSNEGFSWDSLPNPSIKKEDLSITEVNKVFYAVFPNRVSDTLFISSDFGKTWLVKSIPTSLFTGTQNFGAMVDYNGDDLYLFHSQGNQKKIFVSSNQGANWQDITFDIPVNASLSNYYAYRLYRNLNTPALDLLTPISNYNNKGAIYSFDKNAQSWKVLDSTHYYTRLTFKMDTILRTIIIDSSQIDYSKQYSTELSYNNKDWINVDAFITKLEKGDTLINDVEYNSKGIYAETNYGLFFLPYSTITGLSDDVLDEQKGAYVLYPNPSSGMVEIESKEETLFIQITDLQGKVLQVHTAWDTNKPLDISALKTGIYAVKLKGSKEKVIKMMKQ